MNVRRRPLGYAGPQFRDPQSRSRCRRLAPARSAVRRSRVLRGVLPELFRVDDSKTFSPDSAADWVVGKSDLFADLPTRIFVWKVIGRRRGAPKSLLCISPQYGQGSLVLTAE